MFFFRRPCSSVNVLSFSLVSAASVYDFFSRKVISVTLAFTTAHSFSPLTTPMTNAFALVLAAIILRGFVGQSFHG